MSGKPRQTPVQISAAVVGAMVGDSIPVMVGRPVVASVGAGDTVITDDVDVGTSLGVELARAVEVGTSLGLALARGTDDV